LYRHDTQAIEGLLKSCSFIYSTLTTKIWQLLDQRLTNYHGTNVTKSDTTSQNTKRLNKVDSPFTILATLASRKSANFLDLPLELRQMVYDHYFASLSKQSISIVPSRRNRLHKSISPLLKKAGKDWRQPDLSLLLTCREVYFDLAQKVYETCHFGLWEQDMRRDLLTEQRMVDKVSLFRNIMTNHLHFIQHLDMGTTDLIHFVTDEDAVGDDEEHSRVTKKSLAPLMRRSGEGAVTDIGQDVVFFRVLGSLADKMPNVHTITCHEIKLPGRVQLTGFERKLMRMFPNLKELVVLRRMSDGQFEIEVSDIKDMVATKRPAKEGTE
ncbi:hypothetical protein LTR37_011409, partial [Vermiconidia calcicola]